MELVKILKYVEKSFEDKPSFLLLMNDGIATTYVKLL